MKPAEVPYTSNAHARYYARKHGSSLARRLSNCLERRMMYRALNRLRRHCTFETILDVPSGTGRFLPLFSKFHADVIAMDLAQPMLTEGRSADTDLQCPHRMVVGSALAIPMQDDSVDVVFCSRLLHHVPDDATREKMFNELRRVARRGVVVSFFDRNCFYGWKRARKVRRLGRSRGRYGISRCECNRLAVAAGLKPLGMNALFRFHTEVTAATFAVVDPSS